MIARVWCVRHAPVAVDGVCYGQHDVPTRIDARAAATRVLAALDGVAIDAVVTSPWARARSVAERIAEARAVPLAIDARVSELSMGEWEGRRFDEIERADADRFARWMERWRTDAPPGGESIAMLQARVDAWLDDARARGGVQLVLTHAGVIRAIRARLRGLTYEDAVADRVEHLAPERFELA